MASLSQALLVICALLALVLGNHNQTLATDFESVRAEIERVIDDDIEECRNNFAHQCIAPALIRLAWHSAATFDPIEPPHGGANGATMRFEPEASYEDNRGLDVAIDALKPIKELHPSMSYSDLWILAGYVAVERLEGPAIEFEGGRVDAADGSMCPPEDRLPVWDNTVTEVQAIFHRMGLDDRDLVALMGAHSVGHTFPENSGFPNLQWDTTPLKFDNMYYRLLLDTGWQFESSGDREFFFNRSWIMLLTDIMIRDDEELHKIAKEYYDDEALWHSDFAKAFKKITELGLKDGCPRFREPPTAGGCPFIRSGKGAAAGKQLPAGHPPVMAASA